MAACPTCKSARCGNHAACARRQFQRIQENEKRAAWCAEWELQFRAIAACENALDRTAHPDVPREKARELLLDILFAHEIVDRVWKRIRMEALLEGLEDERGIPWR